MHFKIFVIVKQKFYQLPSNDRQFRFGMVDGLRQLVAEYIAEFSTAVSTAEKEEDKQKRLKVNSLLYTVNLMYIIVWLYGLRTF